MRLYKTVCGASQDIYRNPPGNKIHWKRKLKENIFKFSLKNTIGFILTLLFWRIAPAFIIFTSTSSWLLSWR